MSEYLSPYWQRVRERADEMGVDGCSFATSARLDCCLEHDIAYRTGATVDGVPQSKAQADERFLACLQRHSTLGYYSPLAWLRYWAVKKFGRPSAKAST